MIINNIRFIKKVWFFFLPIFLTFTVASAQGLPGKRNWYNLDLKEDGVFGISIEKAYSKLLKGKKALPIIVAVIDGGSDPTHEDLKNVLWSNPKEIPGNGKDDDKNGYEDDLHGWNFMGYGTKSYEFGNELIVLEIRNYQNIFGDKDSTQIDRKDLPEFKRYQSKRQELRNKRGKVNQDIQTTSLLLTDLKTVQNKIGKDSLTIDDFQKFVPDNPTETGIRQFMISVLTQNPDFNGYIKRMREMLAQNQQNLQYKLNLNYNPKVKHIQGIENGHVNSYGNGDIYGSVAPAHGTHVAGIIAAQRGNIIGIDGVADHVRLMIIRAIPDGHAPGKDQASAIRYAADNGAKVINMSFGLGLETDAQLVRDAVNYAIKKDILFICAAGNAHSDIDLTVAYPNRSSKRDKQFNDVFLRVGASGYTDNPRLAVPFSNFGKRNVDVFAPGQDINSTIPGNKYEAHSGTSMAAPVVSGLAAVIREYYPKLTAKQVKDVIMASVVKRDVLKNLCVSGGIVNAFEALKFAETCPKRK